MIIRSRHRSQAERWYKNGDCSGDNVQAVPVEDGAGLAYTDGEVVGRVPNGKWFETCPLCGKQLVYHGWLNQVGMTVCPGNWVVTDARGRRRVLTNDELHQEYEKVEPGSDVVGGR